jgi:hypothetical protein
MREQGLRAVLLVRSIEETDRDGTLLPSADRAEATRTTIRESPGLRDAVAKADPRPGFERFLEARARRLLARLEPRHPALGTLARGGEHAAWAGRLLLLVAFVFGFGLTLVDRSRIVDVLAFPLAGLVLWNLAVYAAVLTGAIRGRTRVPAAAAWYERWLRRRVERWLRRSEEFDAPLARALQAFVAEWHVAARPLLAAHATRLFHLAALTVALGLIAGIYWRGLTLEYVAAWESTFLSPSAVRTVLEAIYGPASLLTGIPLPRTDAEIAALNWRDGGGGPAAPWIHLIAVTAVLWIVVPRALLALVASLRAARLARRAPVPPEALAQARDLLAGQGVETGGQPADAVPYAFELPPGADRALTRVLEAVMGSNVRLAVHPPVAYGAEDAYLQGHAVAPPSSGVVAIVCNLAGTPEAENHGTLIAGLRDAMQRRGRTGRALVVVDASAYARRMGDALASRVAERSTTWLEFVRGYGVEALVVDLERLAADAPDAAAARVREALASARR